MFNTNTAIFIGVMFLIILLLLVWLRNAKIARAEVIQRHRKLKSDIDKSLKDIIDTTRTLFGSIFCALNLKEPEQWPNDEKVIRFLDSLTIEKIDEVTEPTDAYEIVNAFCVMYAHGIGEKGLLIVDLGPPYLHTWKEHLKTNLLYLKNILKDFRKYQEIDRQLILE